jgi:serine/threonine-protein kinase
MGEVYRARDTKLDRDVAIKVLPEELASDRERLRRFEQEARAASALSHPNIITIHDIAEEGSTHYIVMEYVEGKTLREIIGDRALPTRRLLELATQVAGGLAKAHAAGIVHRDLKPENLMVTEDGFVKILDFGLAKLVPGASEGGSEIATMAREGTTPGAVMGTVGYMSPEQAKGLTADFRSDQFSLGAILYEMATGRRAFQRDTAVQTLSAIIESEPASLSDVSPSLPAHLRAIVTRCLAKDPHDRYDSTRDLGRDLKSVQEVSSEAPTEDRVSVTRDGGRLKIQVEEPGGEKIHLDVPERTALLPLLGIVVVSVLALAVGFNVAGLRERLFGEVGPGKIESVAVLPLENLSGDPEQEYFADGMTEALIADLAKIGALKVISRTSVMQYKGVKKPLKEIARELDVDAVVEGSALRVGDRVRITAQLIEAATDQHLWAESYERDMRDVLALQSEVAQAIAQEIQATLTPEERSLLATSRPVDPEAHEAYLKGRYYLNKRTGEALQKGREYFQQAINKDPEFGLAYAGLAHSYLLLENYSVLPPEEAFPKARAAATKALEIDDTLAEAHTYLGDMHWRYYGGEAAEREFRRAIELEPNSARAHHNYGYYLGHAGRAEESILEMQQARELDPLSLIINANVGYMHYFARDYDQAIAEYQMVLEMDPNFAVAHVYLGHAYLEKGMHKESIEAFQEALRLSGHWPEVIARLGYGYASAGQTAHALKMLDKLRELSGEGWIPPGEVALIYVGLGDNDQAIQWLEKAYQKHSSVGFESVKVDPLFDPLRSDPRFQDLLRRMNFPE